MDKRLTSFCVKCKKITDTVDPKGTVVNGRYMLKGKCADCGITKTKFVKASDVKEGGFLGILFNGIKKLFGGKLKK